MNFGRILLSASVIAFVGAAALGGTGAFFSDTETSTGNTFTAGAIDLLIDNTSYGFDWNDPTNQNPTGEWGQNQNNSWQLSDLDNQLFFNFRDLKPGDYGEDTISLHVNNNDAWACMAFNLTGTPENGQNEPEAVVDTTAGENEGELQNHLSFIFWNDDGDNVLETGEEVIDELSGLPGSIFTGDWLPIADSGNAQPLPGDTTHYIGKGWCFGELTPAPVAPAENPNGPTPGNTGFTCDGSGDHNDAQTDGIVVDVSFYAEQSRNNDQFLCGDLPPLEGGENGGNGALVGAKFSAYEIPTNEQCDITATSSIQDAVNQATTGDTVCVPDGTYNETVDIDVEGLTLASLTGPTSTATINGGVIIDAPSVTVTGFKVIPGNTEGSIAGFYLKEPADNAVISFNDIDGTDVGGSPRGIVNVISTDIGNVTIMNNEIHDLASGIYTNPHTGSLWTISYNDIDDNLAGIGQWNGANIHNNEFEHATPGSEAIGVDNAWDANGGTVKFNNFLDDTKINTYGPPDIAGTIDATANFFSTSGATQVDETHGDVNFTPEAVSQYAHQ